MHLKLSLITLSLLIANPIQAAPAQEEPMPILKANEYREGIALEQYWQSEKLDGIRAIWDGKQLTTRTGKLIYAPAWFTAVLPHYPVEGELWAGRGRFSLVQQTVLDHHPTDEAWQQITFMLFDLPTFSGDYQTRYQHLRSLTSAINQTHIQYVKHEPIISEEALLNELDRLFLLDAEGIMLRKFSSTYSAGRNNDLLKLKKHQDSEAQVIGYKMGKGKYHNMVGSLLVRNDAGIEFALGSGLTDFLRQQPPEIGCVITYRFNGLTDSGKPRFARFMRVKESCAYAETLTFR
ncbi:DNA ligase [Vibrio sp. V27_P1S3P104]|uniref:DNA ligase n=1 Tax=unclassified Vibrio TaxID=2614977 RepID=UPI00137368EA|nr:MULTISPECIES: DNA ligase [unclassified Vibrio]NAW69929.1 DNA ligase [Vibrio sp. V28_P6S34P95]NAX04672.1 DNA ligase [Vibrio sp. V30_P3S12P165]NAX35410.1 DNA ligase [Vibrio sp. V29_P1S30P107]NAX37447.1 DNA ligase [Vibrio sp. V27_P1S3P104]NAX41441.1 DNA ligase [Vibrio sp. V26_P1S5P106]